MKITFCIILILNVINAQDSLFWFNMKMVRDQIPKSPKVLDKVFGTSQIDILDSIQNNKITTQNGYRLQIYESSSVEDANKFIIRNKKILEDSLYLIFEAPLYKVKYGDFISKNDAEISKRKISRKGYKNIWIVRSRIRLDLNKQEIQN